jgi:DtxR family manganese transport transcriptional regulator
MLVNTLTPAYEYVHARLAAGELGDAMATIGASTRARKAGEQGVNGDLPAELTQARRFGKTRSAQSTALLEDYVELIADLLAGTGEARPTDIARRLGVSHATAIKTISRLKRAGVATARPYRGVFLTEAGTALAQRVRVRHRLVVDVLRAIGVPAEAAEADAEGIEHHVSETTLKAFARFLQSREEK